MTTLFGLKLIDVAMIVAYFAVVMAIGFWSSRNVKTEKDFFLGGRRFGKGLLTMHWLCTGTHSEMAVQVAGATARVGLGGIWYQPHFSRLQMNLVAPYLDVTDDEQTPRPQCACRRIRGWADQAAADALITAPDHWPPVRRV